MQRQKKGKAAGVQLNPDLINLAPWTSKLAWTNQAGKSETRLAAIQPQITLSNSISRQRIPNIYSVRTTTPNPFRRAKISC